MSKHEPGKNAYHSLLLRVERVIDRLRSERVADEQTIVRCYHGYGRSHRVIVRGRVERRKSPRTSELNDSRRRNFANMAANFFTHEVPFAKVSGRIGSQSFEAVCDDEGYFTQEVDLGDSEHPLWIDFSASAVNADGTSEMTNSVGRIQMCPSSAKRMIISDIDDTVIETGAAKLWQLLKNTLLENVHTRKIFPRVSHFYSRLQAGADGKDQNPIFYVTSSPWNLRDFILKIFELRETPQGPMFMTDWGLGPNKILKDGHHGHKLGAIRMLLNFYSPLPAILIGDSGEQDPEIYSKIVEEFGTRIEVIYIRDVSNSPREKEVIQLAEACSSHGVPLHLIQHTDQAVADALSRGLIKV